MPCRHNLESKLCIVSRKKAGLVSCLFFLWVKKGEKHEQNVKLFLFIEKFVYFILATRHIILYNTTQLTAKCVTQ